MKKEDLGRWICITISVLAPVLFFLMFIPIWGGKEFTHNGILNVLIALQSLCLAISCIYAGVCIRSKKPCSVLCILYGISTFVSVVISGFYFGIFLLELFEIPWFPAQR